MNKQKKKAFAALLIGLSSALVSPAFAQSRPTQALDPAEKLFEEGRTAMATKDYVTACARFESSHKLSPGGGVLANLGDCEERRGRLIAARDAFKSAAELFTKADKKQYALERASSIERTIPRFTVDVSEPKPEGLEVLLDGKPLTARSETQLDPGTYAVVLRAPKHRDKTYSVTLAAGEKRTLTTERLEADAPLVAPAPEKPQVVVSDSSGMPWRTTGFILAGVGAVGLGVGAVTGLMAIGSAGTVRDSCNRTTTPAVCTSQEGLDAMSSGSTQSTLSTVGFVAGGTLLAAGIVMIVVAPKGDKKTAIAPMMGPGAGGVTVWRAF